MIQQPLKEKIYSLEVKVIELQAENKSLKKDMADAGLMTKEEFAKWLARS